MVVTEKDISVEEIKATATKPETASFERLVLKMNAAPSKKWRAFGISLGLFSSFIAGFFICFWLLYPKAVQLHQAEPLALQIDELQVSIDSLYEKLQSFEELTHPTGQEVIEPLAESADLDHLI